MNEQEYMRQAFAELLDLDDSEIIFNSGFQAGLNYSKTKIDELKKLCLEAERYIGGIPIDEIDWRNADNILDKLDKVTSE